MVGARVIASTMWLLWMVNFSWLLPWKAKSSLQVFSHILLSSDCPCSSSGCCHRKVWFVASLQIWDIHRRHFWRMRKPAGQREAAPCPPCPFLNLPPTVEDSRRRMLNPGISVCAVGAMMFPCLLAGPCIDWLLYISAIFPTTFIPDWILLLSSGPPIPALPSQFPP